MFTTCNLAASFASTFEKAKPWYDGFMFDRRLQMARDKGLDLSRVVFDGCLKLCGRVCGRPAAEMVHCPELSLYTACPCSRQPQFKKRRCAEHDCSKPVAGPLLDEVAVAHRRRRILLTEPCEYPYELCLKPTDHVLADTASSVPGRWVAASQCSERQIYEYWKDKAESGFQMSKSTTSELTGLACKTHKESCKDYKRLIKAGRLGGLLVACLPSGHVLHVRPFVGAESITVRYFFIASLKHLV